LEHSVKVYADDAQLISDSLEVHAFVGQPGDQKVADLDLFLSPISVSPCLMVTVMLERRHSTVWKLHQVHH